MAEKSVVLFGVGDVGPIHEPMDIYGAHVRSTLAAGDIRFAQCERLYSDRGALQVHSGVHERPLKAHMASVFSDCGFNVISLASNHGMDWGPDALMDTIELFRKHGMQTVGGGANIKEARQPAIVDSNGIKVAVLAYCSVIKEGYAAGANTPGIAPLRIHTYYEPIEYQAGVPPRVVTVPYEEDLAAMVNDIKEAKKIADVVVVSLHWGIHFIPRLIAEYQPIVAKAAYAAGAALILGHHAHAPKAIGVHGGKVCFYSLSNFIMTSRLTERLMAKENTTSAHEALAKFAKRYGVKVLPGDPLPYGTDSARSLIAKAVITREGVKQASFLPVLIDKQCRPEILKHGDARFDDAVKFMDWLSEDFDHQFTVHGDEVLISGK